MGDRHQGKHDFKEYKPDTAQETPPAPQKGEGEVVFKCGEATASPNPSPPIHRRRTGVSPPMGSFALCQGKPPALSCIVHVDDSATQRQHHRLTTLDDNDVYSDLCTTQSNVYVCVVAINALALHVFEVTEATASGSAPTLTRKGTVSLADSAAAVLRCCALNAAYPDSVLVSGDTSVLQIECSSLCVTKTLSGRNGPTLPGCVAVAPNSSIVVSSEWSGAQHYLTGCNMRHVAQGGYGSTLHFWDLEEGGLVQTCDLGPEGVAPVQHVLLSRGAGAGEVCGYTACCPATTIFYFTLSGGAARAEKVIDIPQKRGGDGMQQGMSTGMCLSPGQTSLFIAQWVHGDVRMYDIADRESPVLIARVALPVPGPCRIRAGPQGTIFASTGFFSAWAKQYCKGCTTFPAVLLSYEDNPARTPSLKVVRSIVIPDAVCVDLLPR